MECPRCGFVQAGIMTECPRCGIVIEKYLRARADGAAHPQPALAPFALSHAGAADLQRDGDARADHHVTVRAAAAVDDADAGLPLRTERNVRAFALPGALLGARLAVSAMPGAVRMLSMWVHESGHAVAAWLCGFAAWPGPWFTPVARDRSMFMTVLCVSALAYGGVEAWRRARWFWVVAAASVLPVLLFCTFALSISHAEQLVIFGGDAGCFVLGTVLMLTLYARPEHPVRSEGLRWVLVVLGALAFMDAYAVWSGSFEHLPFGENENGLSDPSVLTEVYGWSVPLLVSRYVTLARWCLAVVGTAYVAGLVDAAQALKRGAEPVSGSAGD